MAFVILKEMEEQVGPRIREIPGPEQQVTNLMAQKDVGAAARAAGWDCKPHLPIRQFMGRPQVTQAAEESLTRDLSFPI